MKSLSTVTPSSSARTASAAMSLGRQPPPKPNPALRNSRPIRLSYPRASASKHHVAACRLAHLRHRVDEADLGRQERVCGDLDQFAGRDVASHDGDTVADRHRIDLLQHVQSVPRVCSEDQPVGPQRVLHGVRLAQNSGFQATSTAISRRRLSCAAAPPAPSRVPTGTVDLPTTSVGSVSSGASVSTAACN